jgi:biopolymer transport protein ExbD/biopolymer transport protein TolR
MNVSQATGGKRQGRVINEINITPLTDIFLVLLIIMMVVAPMIQSLRPDIKPPQVENGQAIPQGPVTVEITEDGAFFVEGDPVEMASLKDILLQRIEEGQEKNVIVRADKATRSGAVMRVFEAARDAEYEKVTVAGEPLSNQRQQELQQVPREE